MAFYNTQNERTFRVIDPFLRVTHDVEEIRLQLNSCNVDIGLNCCATGSRGPFFLPNTGTIAIGCEAANSTTGTYGYQDIDAIAIGHQAGQFSQRVRAIALGLRSGQEKQGYTGDSSDDEDNGDSIAIGTEAGQYEQNAKSIAIGYQAGQINQGIDVNDNDEWASVAIGALSGQINQETLAVAVGYKAGQTNQKTRSVAIGPEAGLEGQQDRSVAIGRYAGQYNQGTGVDDSGYATAVGPYAGVYNQGYYTVAVGADAGYDSQQSYATAVGVRAGDYLQGTGAIAIGTESGYSNQQENCIAIGYQAGNTNQGTTEDPVSGRSIAIGYQAGYDTQGDHTIAIGYQAGYSSQADNSIVLNATLNSLDAPTTGLFVKPVRNLTSESSFYNLNYNPSSGEVVYGYSSTPGIIQMFAGSSAPNGYLLCDGSSKNVTDYPNLFNVIGYTYGGAGALFNLPNLKGRVPVGLDAAQSEFNLLGETGGAKTHTLTVAQMPVHSHSYSTYVNSNRGYVAANEDDGILGGTQSINTGSQGNGDPHNNLQPYIVLNYIISI